MAGMFSRSLERKARDCEDFLWPQQEVETCQPSASAFLTTSEPLEGPLRPPLPRPAGPLLAPKQPSPSSLNPEPRAQAEGPVCDWGQLWVPGQAFHPSGSWMVSLAIKQGEASLPSISPRASG